MAITFDQVVVQWNATSPGVSGSFTPASDPNNAGVVFVQNESGNSLGVAASDSIGGAWSVALAASNDGNADTHGASFKLTLSNASRTITLTGTAGNSMEGEAILYKGVSAVGSGNFNNQTNPGTGAGAVQGVAVTVPTGSVLVACAKDVSASSSNTFTAVANGGVTPTTRYQQNVAGVAQVGIGEWVGTGGSITPSFTMTAAGSNTVVIQVLLTPPGGTFPPVPGSPWLQSQVNPLLVN